MSEENLVTNSESENKTKKIKIGDIIFYSILILVFAFTVFTTTFWFSSIKIQQTSMLPTFEPNDVVLLDKLSSYSRGDVIVFNHDENEDFIKRVIAVEGDTVYSIDGEVYVEYYNENELVTEKVNEYYLNEQKS
ncbi:MAG: signal peptidase I, partial [Clostridia bacterium]|nr:signal peptidase I [Clostridia bacterium]